MSKKLIPAAAKPTVPSVAIHTQHLDDAALFAVELVTSLGVLRCSPAGRKALAVRLAYLAHYFETGNAYPAGSRPPTNLDERAARNQYDDWCSTNLPRVPWPQFKHIPVEQAVQRIAELLGVKQKEPVMNQQTQIVLSSQPTVPLVRTFDGHPITCVTWQGRQIFFVDEIAAALGYATAHSLRTAIQRDWTDEAEEGVEVLTITNGDIRILERLRNDREDSSRSNSDDSDDPTPTSGGARKLLVLTESGVNLVCIKTEKPAGRALRRWLAREVLPAIRQTGTYQTPHQPPTTPGRDPQLTTLSQDLRGLTRELALLRQSRVLPDTGVAPSSAPSRPSPVRMLPAPTSEPLEAFARAWLAWNDGGWATPKELVPLALQVGLPIGENERGRYASLGHLLLPRIGLVVAGRRLTDVGPHGRRLYSLSALA